MTQGIPYTQPPSVYPKPPEMGSKQSMPPSVSRTDSLFHQKAPEVTCSNVPEKSLDEQSVKGALAPPKEDKICFGYHNLSCIELVARGAVFSHPSVPSSSVALEQVRTFVARKVLDLIISPEFRLGLIEVYGQQQVDELLGIGSGDSVFVEIREQGVLITQKDGKTREFAVESFGSYAEQIQKRLQATMDGLTTLLTKKEPRITGCSVTGSLVPQTQDALSEISLLFSEQEQMKNEIQEILKGALVPQEVDSRFKEMGNRVVIAGKECIALLLQVVPQHSGEYGSLVKQHLRSYYEQQIVNFEKEIVKECHNPEAMKKKGLVLLYAWQKLAHMSWMVHDAIAQTPPLIRRRVFLELERKKTASQAVYQEGLYEALLWLSLLDPAKQKQYPGLARFDIKQKAATIYEAFKQNTPGFKPHQKEISLCQNIHALHDLIQSQ